MTDYLPITDAETDPGAPGTSELWKKWRDNPLAMFEGAVDAPRIQVGAFPETTAGDTVKYMSAGSISTDQTTYQKVLEGKFLGRGALTIEFVVGTNIGGTYIKVQKNDVGVYTNPSPNPGTYSFDLSYAVGDRFSIFYCTSGASSARASLSVKLKTGGEDIFLLNGLMSPEPSILGGTWY